MKLRNFKHFFLSAAVAAMLLPASLSAADGLSVGDLAPRPETAVQVQPGDGSLDKLTFTQGGTPVFVSNAPEALYEGNRSDGSDVVQVNTTLYRDQMNGSFRFWSAHTNATKKKVAFYMHVKNPSLSPVKLYIKRKGYSSGTSADPVTSLKAATEQFMKLPEGIGGTLLATIPPKGSYTLSYSTSVAPYQVMNYIGDFRAVNVKTGQSAAVIVSDVVTNNGVSKVNEYAASTRIAVTNGDDYRGLLKHSARTVDVKLELTPEAPAKYMKVSDSVPYAYPGEQEPLMTRWSVEGEPLKAPVEVVKGSKKRGSYWFTDLTYKFEIKNSSGLATVHTLYGGASRSENTGYVHYKIDEGTLHTYSFGARQTRVISDSTSFTLKTVIQPFMSVPLGLYFTAE
ncbi:hypothetical protein [Paenibacillus sp. J22TS3]|uniref:hypothetical protein n=1 Tax=Paenibacillus sp. J22TS3 TaxID=2807192 RepID=UPI001B09CBE0|nr:hypothetical protein [Paenibacillus sp. J22TS3]GIP23697.1 hypothetical protein J22TS3_39720 [Paenibacillus sp. J22TS3]